MSKKILIAATAVFIGLAPMAHADDLFPDAEKALGGKFSANVGLVSEYLFRGLTQSGDNTPAIQGGFDFAHDSGVYVGVWGSSINFGGDIETDVYGGWSGDIDLGGTSISLDAGAILYAYPNASSSAKLDYWEGYVGVTKDFGFLSANVKFSYSPDWTGTTKSDAEYIEGNVDVLVGKYFTVNLHAGHQWYQKNLEVGFDDYTDWSAGVSATVAGFDVSVSYIGTDLPHSQLDAYGQSNNHKFVASVSRSF